MRCPQCGSNMSGDAMFCSRCGARLYEPKPADKREYALLRVHPAWWHFLGRILASSILIAFGFAARFTQPGGWTASVVLFTLAALVLMSAALRRRFITWSLTSERVIESKGILSRHRREIELADVRSVDIERRFIQRAMGLGDILIASSASADFYIKLGDVPDPEGIAETLRRARLKRLA